MDDLNGDGRINEKDAAVLYAIIEEAFGEPQDPTFLGGLGKYRSTPAHGPFVHLDLRGFRVRW